MLLTGVFMAALDVAIVNVAAPQIQADLDISDGGLQLVVSGYTMAYATLLVTGARLGDQRGHRRMFLLGLSGFTAASLGCGLASSSDVLIAGRVLQGIFAAAMTPQVITVIQLTLVGVARARALALWATVIAMGVVVGQVAGGVIVSADVAGLSWRPVFLVNVPIGVCLLAAGWRLLPHTRRQGQGRLDVTSVLILSITLLLIVVPLVLGRDAEWAAWTWISLGLAVPAAIGLSYNLRLVARRGGQPLLDPALLRRRDVAMGLGSLSAVMAAYGGFLFSVTLFLQVHLDFSPVRSGLTFGPYAAAFGVAAVCTPRLRLPARVDRVAPAVGLALLGAGYAAIGLLSRDGTWSAGAAVPVLLVTGAGFGVGYNAIIGRTVSSVPPAQAHEASGLLTTSVQLSFVLGVAAIGTIYLAADSPGAGFARAAAIEAGLALCAAFLAFNRHRADDQSVRPGSDSVAPESVAS